MFLGRLRALLLWLLTKINSEPVAAVCKYQPSVFVIGACSLGLAAVFLLRQVLFAEFGIIDDHEIMHFLGNSTRLPWSDVWDTVVTKTEVGSPLSSQRYRPFFYSLMVVETALWGDNPHLWYAARLFMFAGFLGCVGWSAIRLIGTPAAVVLVSYLVFLRFWGGVWARLIPSEIYGSVGFGIWLVCALQIFLSAVPKQRFFAGLIVGTFILCGSKETLLPFAALSVGIIALNYRKAQSIQFLALIMAGCLLPNLWIASVMVQQLSLRGTDLYGQTVSVSHRTDLALAGMRHVFMPGLFTVLLIGAMWQRPAQPRWQRASLWFAVGVASIAALYVSQFVAYNGLWPSGGRYDFPGQLCLPAFWVAMTAYLGHLDQSKLPLVRIRQMLFVGATIVLHNLYAGKGDLSRAHPTSFVNSVSGNISETVKFTRFIQNVANEAIADPRRAIVLDCRGGIFSFEPAAAIARYLRYNKVSNPVAMRYAHADVDDESQFYKSLSAAIERLQMHGLEATGDRWTMELVAHFRTIDATGGPRLMPLASIKSAGGQRPVIVPVGLDKIPVGLDKSE